MPRDRFHSRWLRCLLAGLFVCAICLWAPRSDAQTPNPYLDPRPAPRISLLTFGPGDEAFLRFGHNALRVVDATNHTDLVYNFGTFRFDNPWLILDFLTGRFQYWLSVGDYQTTVRGYRDANRSVTEQVLNLGLVSSRQLAERLAENALPKNRAYLYDYYRDNCSTRIRDVVDGVLNGRLHERFEDRASFTLRDHTLRAVADDFWLYIGLDIAMGSYIDQSETRWGEMFLPEKLANGFDATIFSGPHGNINLVKERKEIYKAKGRPQARRSPPRRTWQFLQAGLSGGLFLAFLGWEGYRRRQRWAQVCLAGLLAVIGLVAGTLGCLFVGLWAFTDHQVAYRNENILQCPPWTIGLVWLAWGLYRGNALRIQWTYQVLWAALLASAFGLLAKALPFMAQHNERIIAFTLPLWAGAFFAVYLMRLRISTPHALNVGNPSPAPRDEAEPEPEPPPRPSWRPSKQPPAPSDKDESPSSTPGAEPAPA